MKKLSNKLLLFSVSTAMLLATGCGKDDEPDPGTGGTGGGAVVETDYVSWGVEEQIGSNGVKGTVSGAKAVRLNMTNPAKGTATTNIQGEIRYEWKKPTPDTIVSMQILATPREGTFNNSSWDLTVALGSSASSRAFFVQSGTYILSKNSSGDWVSTLTGATGVIGDANNINAANNTLFPDFKAKITWTQP